jgi:hypothetical protein
MTEGTDTVTADTLRPCDYCGFQVKPMRPGALLNHNHWVVWCARCGASGPVVGESGYVETKEEAVALYDAGGKRLTALIEIDNFCSGVNAGRTDARGVIQAIQHTARAALRSPAPQQ